MKDIGPGLGTICISPDALSDYCHNYCHIFYLYQTCMDSLHHLRILAEDDSFPVFDRADKEHIDYLFGRFGSILETVEDLYYKLIYVVNQSDSPGLISWIQIYCDEAPEHFAINQSVLCYMHELEHQLVKLERKRRKLFADCEDEVYSRDEFIERKQHDNQIIDKIKTDPGSKNRIS